MAEIPKPKPKQQGNAVTTLEQAALLVNKNLDDCLAFKDYGDKVVVVTTNGQKITVARDASI
ncbi:MAG: hypothetical protein NTW85_06525 [Methylococcales bacterium]|nr:hypothetical protein [Methylococcales bacterium]